MEKGPQPSHEWEWKKGSLDEITPKPEPAEQERSADDPRSDILREIGSRRAEAERKLSSAEHASDAYFLAKIERDAYALAEKAMADARPDVGKALRAALLKLDDLRDELTDAAAEYGARGPHSEKEEYALQRLYKQRDVVEGVINDLEWLSSGQKTQEIP